MLNLLGEVAPEAETLIRWIFSILWPFIRNSTWKCQNPTIRSS